MRIPLLLLWGLVAASTGGAATFQDDLSGDPLQNGWQIFGDTNLFYWDSTNQNLAVTWDSSQTNSYFYHDLGTILARDDSFHLSFDLTFQDYASGTTPGKSYDFEAAIGLLNLANATQPDFSRGAGISEAQPSQTNPVCLTRTENDAESVVCSARYCF